MKGRHTDMCIEKLGVGGLCPLPGSGTYYTATRKAILLVMCSTRRAV